MDFAYWLVRWMDLSCLSGKELTANIPLTVFKLQNIFPRTKHYTGKCVCSYRQFLCENPFHLVRKQKYDEAVLDPIK